MRSKTQLNQLKMLKGVKRVNNMPSITDNSATLTVIKEKEESFDIENSNDHLFTLGQNMNTESGALTPNVPQLNDLERLAGMNKS